MLIIIVVTKHGYKDLIAVKDDYRKSEENLAELFNGLQLRGLTVFPMLDMEEHVVNLLLEFNGKDISEYARTTNAQRCWVQKTANFLSSLSNVMQHKIKPKLY